MLWVSTAVSALQNNTDHNDADQQPTSKNVTTDSDPALECNATQDDKLNTDDEENDDPLNEYRAPVCETCSQLIIPHYSVNIIDGGEQSTGNEVYSIAPGETNILRRLCLINNVKS